MQGLKKFDYFVILYKGKIVGVFSKLKSSYFKMID